MRLHIENPTVVAEERRSVDDAAGLPDARTDRYPVTAWRIQFGDTSRREVVVEIQTPDAAIGLSQP